MLIPKTILGSLTVFMQMRYSSQLFGMYSFAFISECDFTRCVVLPDEGKLTKTMRRRSNIQLENIRNINNDWSLPYFWELQGKIIPTN